MILVYITKGQNMINSVSSNQMMPLTQVVGQKSLNAALTSTQLETISSVLSQFDASSLTQDDASSIVKSFQEAGIEPSTAMESAMKDAGFDAKEIGDLAGVGQGRGQGQGQMMPPPPKKGEADSISQLLDTLLSTNEDDSTTTSTSSSDNSFDQIMEYTSKILNLNDASKSDVMDILDKYSNDTSDYSNTDKSKLVVNSLNSILGDSTNYNRLSLYA